MLTVVVTVRGMAQSDVLPSNSFAGYYTTTGLDLQYNYDEESIVHNYSGNWDLDEDGIRDEIYFIGTGGAHLYYYLRVVLSSDKKVRDFKYLESDAPVYTPALIPGALNKMHVADNFTAFSILQERGKVLIFLRLDHAVQLSAQKVLQRYKVTTGNILLGFNKGKVVLKDYTDI